VHWSLQSVFFVCMHWSLQSQYSLYACIEVSSIVPISIRTLNSSLNSHHASV
jgi:hypothetical protein